MKNEKFINWWFEEDGESITENKFGHTITEKDLQKQPSYPNKENAYTEALWEKALKSKLHLD